MDAELITMILQAISTVGFPIFVACWLLWRDARRIEAFTEALIELRKAIEVLTTRLGKE